MPRFWIGCVCCAVLLAGCGAETEPVVVPIPESSSGQDEAEASSSVAATSDSDAPSRADSEAAAGETSAAAGGAVELELITLAAPDEWTRKPASSGFVLAEFVLPKAEGDDADGRLTVSVAGGGIEANVDRWRSQFGDNPANASEEKIEAGGLEITLVDFSGEFNDQRGPFAPGAKRPGYRMLAAIIPVDGQLHFVKATGPEKTIAAHAEKFEAFVRSVQKR